MQDDSPTRARTGRIPGAAYRRLAYATPVVTFALIIVGGVVRISDSGLGCGAEGAGTHGWPLCGGRAVPAIDTHMIVEYTHRVLAAAVTVMIAVLAVQAWRRYRQNTALVRTSFAALGLIFVQAALGGLTVEKGLEEELVAIHLGVAMLQIGLLLLIARLSQPDEVRRPAWPRPASTRAVRTLAVFASTAVLATIVAGGYVAGTEKNGTPEEHRAVGAHEACGNEFPACGGEFMPFGRSTPIDIQLTHRALMYLAAALVLALFVTVLAQRRRLQPEAGRRLTAAAATSVALLVAQVLLGAVNVWAGEHAWLIVAHLTVGTVLWLSLVRFALEALDVAEAARAAPARRTTAEAAPA